MTLDGDCPPEEDVRALLRTRLFVGVDEEALSRLLARASRRVYGRRDVVVEPGEQDGYLFLLVKGVGRLDRLSPTGAPLTVEVLKSGDLRGAAHAAPELEVKSRLTAIVDGTVVYQLAGTQVRTFMKAHPLVADRILARLFERLLHAYDLASALAHQTVAVRLAHLLCELAKQSDGGLVRETQEDLAAMVGAAREEVTRALREFRRRNLVVSIPHRPGLSVPDPARLVREIDPDAA